MDWKAKLRFHLVTSMLLLWAAGAAGARSIYVDADANGAGTGWSWADAFVRLQDALAVASKGDEVRVAEGIYRPDEDSANPDGSGECEAAFWLKSGVAVRGGYAGLGQEDPNGRDIDAHETVLSGDLNEDDGPGFSNNGENSYHVVAYSSFTGMAVLEGFTITGGNARADTDWDGGGLINIGGRLRVSRCKITGNSADSRGGGVLNFMFGDLAMTNCSIIGNHASFSGGMENRYYSEATLVNCAFLGNEASYGGGGFGNSGAEATVINCVISGNWAEWRGGGMYNRFDTDVTVTNSIVWGNTAGEGPQITLWYNSVLSISYSDVQGGQQDVNVVESIMDWGDGNIDEDPCFAGPGYWDISGLWVGGDYRLQSGSGCIDRAENAGIPLDADDLDGDGNTVELIPVDLGGHARIVDGDKDGNSVVDMGAYEFFVPPVEVWMIFTPRVLNPESQGRRVKAHFVFPEGYAVEDIDANSPAKITGPVEVESDYINVFINDEGFVAVEAGFDHSALCMGEPFAGTVTVMGLFSSGDRFYGVSVIRLSNNVLRYVAGLSLHWLETGCGPPDWCEGSDVDRDSTVNFADFALLDGCSIETGVE
ncbi:MAG TPA: hypothetical protein VMX13_12050 [Sedimentisphaerales bacterium]|nr:hypothetical protein [Sedimentisphaerales bacterium]